MKNALRRAAITLPLLALFAIGVVFVVVGLVAFLVETSSQWIIDNTCDADGRLRTWAAAGAPRRDHAEASREVRPR